MTGHQIELVGQLLDLVTGVGINRLVKVTSGNFLGCINQSRDRSHNTPDTHVDQENGNQNTQNQQYQQGLSVPSESVRKRNPIFFVDQQPGLDEVHLQRLQEAFIARTIGMGLYEGSVVNLDFHTVPHFGDQSALERHWAGARGKVMKGALTLFAQDAESKLLLYTQADIQRAESDDQVLQFVNFWSKMHRGVMPTLIFDSRFTTYANLSKLNADGIKFITLRRRGNRLVANAQDIKQWQRIHIPHGKRKYPNPLVHESTIELRGYDGELRQVIMKNNGREAPTFLISNDTELPVELLVGNYARRWRVENSIAEAVSFFNLNALSSPILVKVHFDVLMTLIADTFYTLLARKLRGFEECDAPKLFRHFVKGKGTIEVRDGQITVTYPRRAHNPILRAVPWQQLPSALPTYPDVPLSLRFS